MNIFYVPVVETSSVKNYENSVLNRITYDNKYIADIGEINKISENSGFWGFSEGDHKNRNYDLINKGDVIFFRIKDKGGFPAMDGFGYISRTIKSEDISCKIWGTDIYENIISIDRYIKFETPLRLLDNQNRFPCIDNIPDSVWHNGYNMFRQWKINDIVEEEFIDLITKSISHIEFYEFDFSDAEKLYGELKELNIDELGDTEKYSIIKQRIGQGTFKKKLSEKGKRCKICNLNDERFLIASHIKPWKDSNNMERLDENNGFLLCPHHDSLFDKGLISFSDEGSILISKSLSESTIMLLNIDESKKLNLNENQKIYIKWHRKNVFKQN